jgi:hypothetical protein
MEDLITALQLFKKYMPNPQRTIVSYCHEEIRVNLDPDTVSKEDKELLKELGFEHTSEYFYSY